MQKTSLFGPSNSKALQPGAAWHEESAQGMLGMVAMPCTKQLAALAAKIPSRDMAVAEDEQQRLKCKKLRNDSKHRT